MENVDGEGKVSATDNKHRHRAAGREVIRELRPVTQIAPDLLAPNRHSVNQAYEIMGFRTALSMGWQWHALSSKLRPSAGQFGEKMRERGLKSPLAWRDGRPDVKGSNDNGCAPAACIDAAWRGSHGGNGNNSSFGEKSGGKRS